MKKFFLAAALVAMSATAFAQDEFLPEKGSISTEVQFNPFSNNFETFKIDQLKVRYFIGDNQALRFGIGFSFGSDKNDNSTTDVEAWKKVSNGSFSINLGYEQHFVKRGRIDLYAGAGIGYERTFASSKKYYKDNNGFSEAKTNNYYENAAGEYVRAENIFGVDIFTGIDFYVYKGLYVGAELGLNLNFGSTPKISDEVSGTGIDKTKTEYDNKVKTFNFATVCTPALRLGWTF